jgi:fido (protein-threonine AMPylation protein)
VDPYKIPIEIKKLCDDCDYWIQNKTYDWNEIAARFHHKVVWIHPFANGNGRFSRILTDILLKKYQQTPLTWGGAHTQKMILQMSQIFEPNTF